MAYAWGTMLKYVRTGDLAHAYHEIFGRPFWDDLDAHPAASPESFDALIGPLGHGTPNPEFEIITGGWDSVKTGCGRRRVAAQACNDAGGDSSRQTGVQKGHIGRPSPNTVARASPR